jgi:aminoglycoside phosphotransferase (APT) family kinase protein
MFTKPSLSDLLEGVMNTAESVLLPALEGTPAAEVVTGLLMALSRVQAEWPTAAWYLAEDNLDIEHTLSRIRAMTASSGRSLGLSAVDGPSVVPARGGAQAQPRSTHELSEHHRRWKAALTRTIDALDLPAGPDVGPSLRHADLEVQQLLVRMLHRERSASAPQVNSVIRKGVPLDGPEAERMGSALEQFLATELTHAHDIRVTKFRGLAGGASREAFTFEVSWSSDGRTSTETCVLLRQPVSSVLQSDESEHRITGTRRLPQVEFRIIQLMEAQGIRVPHVLWVEPTGAWLGRPFAVFRWIEGEADLAKLADQPNLERILDDYIEILAQVHNVDPVAAGFDFLGAPSVVTAALEQIELFDRACDAQRLEEFPGITYLIRWLTKHQPTASRVSVIHGDFRLGNFMWDDTGIVAVLDWEQCHLGDPLEEIAFMYWHSWSLESFIALPEFIRRYEAASGIPVDLDALAFYRVFIELKMSVVVLTGIKSFFATPERQLVYGANNGFQHLRECQIRVIEELLNGGPTFEFRAAAASHG